MITNRIQIVSTADILIDRSRRQRKTITPESVIDLAISIGNSQWIAPLLVDSDTNHLIAGERRLTSVGVLNAAVNGDYSSFAEPESARTQLYPICSCKVDSWHQWTKVPVQFGTNLSDKDLLVYEFIENAQRSDLTWQEQAEAIYAIHVHGLSSEKGWTATHTAQLVGSHHSIVSRIVKVWRHVAVQDPDPKLVELIQSSPTRKSAEQNLDRYLSRRAKEEVTLTSVPLNLRPADAETSLRNKPGIPVGTVAFKSESRSDEIDWSEDEDTIDQPSPSIPATFADQHLFNADFNEWAASYTGEPFNFIHCDFPYGISFNKGEQARTVGNQILGEYDDSEEVYWTLLQTLAMHKDSLIAPSAHVMFWFSQNLRRETEDFLTQMGAVVQPFLLIWHCSDLDGILPDPQRFGRRTYETAMLATFGDRKIVQPRGISVAAPRGAKSRVHRSQKPLMVLESFFDMFVDDSSRVLDPTCGSGTSLLAANTHKAAQIVGLERDEDIYKSAAAFINSSTNGVSL